MNPHEAHFDRLIIRAAAVADGNGVYAAPGAILLSSVSLRAGPVSKHSPMRSAKRPKHGHVDNLTFGECCLEATGSPQIVGEMGSDVPVIDYPDAIVVPALVNAHAHLDLSHIGPQPAPGSGGFPAWAEMIRARRATADQDIAESVQLGVDLAIRGGTAAIGDIAGGRSSVPIEVLRRSALGGASFIEVFGIGRTQARSSAFLRAFAEAVSTVESGIRLGVQPHAPYSCGLDLYRAAADMGLPLSTHLAETLEEIEFVRSGTGPLAEMLKRLGVWDDSITGALAHPIDHLEPILREHPFVAAHVNYLEDRHIDVMSRWPISVAYCPRASAYFGHPHAGHPPHRYRQMIEAGINVALGTDSIVCLPPEQADRLSVLDEMRFLHKRDGTDPLTLLRMATINGARALNLSEELFNLKPGPCSGLIAVTIDRHDSQPPLISMLRPQE